MSYDAKITARDEDGNVTKFEIEWDEHDPLVSVGDVFEISDPDQGSFPIHAAVVTNGVYTQIGIVQFGGFGGNDDHVLYAGLMLTLEDLDRFIADTPALRHTVVGLLEER